MPERPSPDLERMLTDVEWAISKQFAARDLVPMLENLVRAAPAASEAAYFAKLRLSELIVGSAPFRAARLARDVLVRGESDRAWAVLGLAHTLLGNYRIAARSYRRALALAPECAVYEHNLGHVLDVALDRPRDALVHLERAHRVLPGETEIASSYAHALLRSGQLDKARALLALAVKDPQEAEEIFKAWQYANGNTLGTGDGV
ncbi:MAG TPA: tetratricopeptide repeat protein [Polyangiaceae bacterium]|nr:tetratricopeptide repeat protein [Polyangiaceae bacterium]